MWGVRARTREGQAPSADLRSPTQPPSPGTLRQTCPPRGRPPASAARGSRILLLPAGHKDGRAKCAVQCLINGHMQSSGSQNSPTAPGNISDTDAEPRRRDLIVALPMRQTNKKKVNSSYRAETSEIT